MSKQIRERFRFCPPALPLDAELRWALLRAFGPLDAQAPADLDIDVALTLAGRLGLAARIGARARGARELRAAPGALSILARACASAAVAQLLAREAASEIAAAAQAVGTQCCFLKGVALEAMGASVAGGRPIGDVDTLVPADGMAPLIAALAARGYRTAPGEDYPHHAAPLFHPRFGALELHRHLPGVRCGRRGFATYADLEAAGLLVGWGEAGEAATVPSRPAMVAHLLAHALAQHGFRADAYPLLRSMADLIDLGVATSEGDAIAAAALPMMQGAVPREEVQAAAAACRLLASGAVDELAGGSAGARLLRHMIAAVLDENYARALKVRELAHALSERSRWLAGGAAAWQALALSRAQIDRIYGPSRSGWGYLGRRLQRPVDLLRRGWAGIATKTARQCTPTIKASDPPTD